MQWTPDEDALLIKLRAQKMPYKEMAVVMGRSIHSLDTRYRYLHLPEGARQAKNERHNEGKRAARAAAADPLNVPYEVLEDRAARLSAPITLTGMLFGDPPVGFSALDRRAHA